LPTDSSTGAPGAQDGGRQGGDQDGENEVEAENRQQIRLAAYDGKTYGSARHELFHDPASFGGGPIVAAAA
jgi:hypothetical protein